jgi:arylformamidase
MQIFDITLTISPGLPVWPGDPAIQFNQLSDMNKGDSCNVTHISMGVHVGTHVDAPHHFLNDNRTVEDLDLYILTGQAYLIEFPYLVDQISDKLLEVASIPAGVERLLIKTRNSELWSRGTKEFFNGFVAINNDGAKWLVQKGIKLIGVDYLSVAPFGDGVPTHRTLLKAGVIALEGLNLSQVSAGYYDLYCLPLKLGDSDGAPARVILMK